jgi:ABC-2 type transport system permease protein
MNNRYENYLKVVLGLLSMTFLIYIGSTLFKKVRYDITEENLYTLSPGTKSILSKIDSPMTLKLYYSKTAANKGTEGLRAFNNHFNYVKDLLGQYTRYSRNNLNIEVIDPRPDTPEEEDALMYGLKKFNLTDTERYFFGLVAESESGSEKIIEFFDPNQKDKLEYDLTKLIYTTLNPQKKNIGVLSSLDVLKEDVSPYMAQIMRMQGRDLESSWISTKLLKDFYQVKKMEQDKEITGLDTLVIIHPKGFSENTLFYIDQYLMKGGSLLVFIDPHAVSDLNPEGMRGISSSPDAGFKKLMDKWGVELKENTYAGDKILSGVGRFNPNQPAGRLLPLVNCNEACTADYKDNVTSGIDQALFVFPGVLEYQPTEGVKYSTILSTTKTGNSYQAFPYEMNNPEALWRKFKEGTKPVKLGLKLQGKFKSAYPDGIKDIKNDIVTESQKESAILIFSDVDFIADQFAFKNTFLGPAIANDNSTLFLNSVEALSGDLDLLSVRTKGRINRSFKLINEIELEAQKRTAKKVSEINASISKFQNELNQLGRQVNDGNIALIQNEGLKKKKELAKKIASLKRELREVKREGREKIEGIGNTLRYINTLLIPSLIILFGIFYHWKRSQKGQVLRQKYNNKETTNYKELKV